MLSNTRSLAFAVILLTSVSQLQAARFREDETLRQASSVFQQVLAAPGNGIPKQLLSDAQGVAIIPQVKGGAFVIGVRMGRGVFIGRDAKGQWEMPRFIDLTGGSVGWQAGIQSTDVILVFRSRESVANLLQGKLTVGADASVAAGPVGRQVSAGTDLPMNAEIYSYSRSRGAFLGVSLDGSVIRQDQQADAEYYQQAAATGQQPVLASQLVAQITQYTSGASTEIQPVPMQEGIAVQPNTNQFATSASPLAESWQRLQAVLTPEWQQYLAIPTANEFTNAESYRDALIFSQARYETIAANPQYAQSSGPPRVSGGLRTIASCGECPDDCPRRATRSPPAPDSEWQFRCQRNSLTD